MTSSISRKAFFIWLLPLILLVNACQNRSVTELYRDENQAYRLNYEYQLQFKDNEYKTQATIDFKLATYPQKPIVLNIKKMQPSTVTINGRYLYPTYQNQSLSIPARLLKSGNNQIKLTFAGQYEPLFPILINSKAQAPQTHIDLSQYQLNQFLPSLIQSYQFATVSIIVSAPANWQLLGFNQGIPCSIDDETKQCVQFLSHQRLNLNNINLFAGVFQKSQLTDDTRLALYQAQQESNSQQAINWLETIQQELEQIESYLGVFPFTNLDVIALAINPIQVYDGILIAPKETLDNASLINKTLINFWIRNALNLPDTEQWFSKAVSQYIYQQIQAEIGNPYAMLNTIIAHSNNHLDKKSRALAALQQLELVIGKARLRTLMRQFITDNLNKPVNFASFVHFIELKTHTHLYTWLDKLINAQDTQTISINLECSEGVISQLELKQESSLPIPKQYVEIGLYHQDQLGLYLDKLINVKLSDTSTLVKSAENNPCPDFIWPNEGGFGIFRVKIDKHHLKHTSSALGKINSSSTSILWWRNLWQGVLAGDVSPQDYLSLVLLNVPELSDLQTSKLISQQLEQLKDFLTAMTLIPRGIKHNSIKAITQLSLQKAMTSQDNPELQQIWLNSYIQLADDKYAYHHLMELLTHPERTSLPALTNEQKFHILQKLVRVPSARITSLIFKLNKEGVLNREQLNQLSKTKYNRKHQYSDNKRVFCKTTSEARRQQHNYWLTQCENMADKIMEQASAQSQSILY